MRRQLNWSGHLFRAGILLMLATGIPAAIAWPQSDILLLGLTGAGAALALAARIGQRRWLDVRPAGDDAIALGGYPLSLLRDPRFTSRRGARV